MTKKKGKKYFKCSVCGKAIERNYNEYSGVIRCYECQLDREETASMEQYNNCYFNED